MTIETYNNFRTRLYSFDESQLDLEELVNIIYELSERIKSLENSLEIEQDYRREQMDRGYS